MTAIRMSDRRAKWDIIKRDARVKDYPMPAGSPDPKEHTSPSHSQHRKMLQCVSGHLMGQPASEKVHQHAQCVLLASKISVVTREPPRDGTVRCWCRMRSPRFMYEHDRSNDPLPFIANALECRHPGGPSEHLDFYFWFDFPESVFA